MSDALEKRQSKAKETFLKHLRQAPVIEFACKRSGVPRPNVYRWRKTDSVFDAAIEDAMSQGIEVINDMAESQIMALIRQGKLPAAIFWLRHNHPRYRAPGKEVPLQPPQRKELSPDQKALFKKALNAIGKKADATYSSQRQ